MLRFVWLMTLYVEIDSFVYRQFIIDIVHGITFIKNKISENLNSNILGFFVKIIHHMHFGPEIIVIPSDNYCLHRQLCDGEGQCGLSLFLYCPAG